MMDGDVAQPTLVQAIRKFPDFDEAFWPIYDRVRPYTMTSPEKLYDLYKSVEYVVRAGVPGAVVECGVWKGGSMMLVAWTLKMLSMKQPTQRPLVMFDTFEGLPPPDPECDVDLLGNVAAERYRPRWAYAGLGEVQSNMALTGYDLRAIGFVQGMVEDTLRKLDDIKFYGDRYFAQPGIAIARLDTDWYASTRVELEVLWPLISPGGLLIVDDYGHWQGARQATDEYFADKPVKMTRVDYSCRVVQKHD